MTSIPLITTTVRTGHNPGDTFIGVGLQHLFERALGSLRWILLDRFSPAGFRRYESLIRAAPFLVYGGMPQYNNYDDWVHWYDEPMWRDYLLPWGLKVYTMAGGVGFSRPDISVEEYVAYCLKSEKTRRLILARTEASLCFTARDPYAHALLNALGIPNHHLPCSATWATRTWGIHPADVRPYLLVIPPPLRRPRTDFVGRLRAKERRRRIVAERWANLYRALRARDENVKTLCHAYDDFLALRDLVPADDLWYHGDCYTLLREYASAHTVVSGRLHASLPAYGLAGTRVVHLSVDVRGSAVGLFPRVRHLVGDEFDSDAVLAALDGLEPSAEEDFARWEEAYVAVIRDALPDGFQTSRATGA